MYKGIEKLTFCGNILWQHFFPIDLGDTLGHIQIFYYHLKRPAIKLNHQIEKNKMLFWRSLLIFWVQKSVTFPQFLYLHFLYYWNWKCLFYQRPSCIFIFHENVLSMFSSWYFEISSHYFLFVLSLMKLKFSKIVYSFLLSFCKISCHDFVFALE